jgi:histidyl-tRNA synthetase
MFKSNDQSQYELATTINMGNPLDDAQRQQQMQRMNNLDLAQERQRQFQQLESDVIDLNSMFKDLAIITQDQQETISKRLD